MICKEILTLDVSKKGLKALNFKIARFGRFQKQQKQQAPTFVPQMSEFPKIQLVRENPKTPKSSSINSDKIECY